MGKAKKSGYKPARKLPAKIANRWRAYREKQEEEEIRWSEVDKMKDSNVAEKPKIVMLEESSGRRKSQNKIGTKKKKKDKVWT